MLRLHGLQRSSKFSCFRIFGCQWSKLKTRSSFLCNFARTPFPLNVTTSLCAWVDSLQNNLQNRCSQWKWLHIHKHITYTVWCCCTLSFCIHIDRCFVWRGLEVCCVMSIKFVHSWICPSICTLMIENFEFFVSKYMFFSWLKIGEPVTCIDILHRELSPSLTSPRYIRTHVYAYMNCWNIFTNWAIHLPNRTFFLRILYVKKMCDIQHDNDYIV